jgi:hypothetical protein
MRDDWHPEPAMAAIKLAAQVPGKVADALGVAIASQQARERLAARKRETGGDPGLASPREGGCFVVACG